MHRSLNANPWENYFPLLGFGANAKCQNDVKFVCQVCGGSMGGDKITQQHYTLAHSGLLGREGERPFRSGEASPRCLSDRTKAVKAATSSGAKMNG